MNDHEQLGATLALVNACLNGTAFVLLVSAWRAIKAANVRLHRGLMLSAFTVSCLFLVSYGARVVLTGTHRYPGHGAWKAIYLGVLLTHTLLAATVPFLAIRSLFLALKSRFAEHKRLVRYTMPIWAYVSATGVLVYLLLYHPPG